MTFKTNSNTLLNVKTMTVKGKFRLAKHGHMTAVHMLYETPGMGAWFVKNSEPTKGYEDAISYDNLRSFIQQEFVSRSLTSSKSTLLVKVPKFTLQYSMDLKNVFQNVKSDKITKVFQAGNLDRMTTSKSEYFSIFKQNCMLKVDPKGTTAAAVTFAGTTRGMGSRPKTVTFAHTFYMVIHYLDTILFVAKIGCPSDVAESGEGPDADTAPDTTDKSGHVSAHFVKEEMDLQKANLTPTLKVCMAKCRRDMNVRTKLHDGKDDETGEFIDKKKITDVYEDQEGIAIAEDQVERMLNEGSAVLVRTYTVDPGLLIRVSVSFPMPQGLSPAEQTELSETKFKFKPVYVKENGEQEAEDWLVFKHNEPPYELPFPLQKDLGEEEDGWLFLDEWSKPFLKLRFRLE